MMERGEKSFRDYLKEAMEELEKENWNYKECRRTVERAVSMVIELKQVKTIMEELQDEKNKRVAPRKKEENAERI
jgi:hypothetical protein